MIRFARGLVFALALVALAWGVSLFFTGGIRLRMLGFQLTSTDPVRPMAVGGGLLIAFRLLGGRLALVRDWARAFWRVHEPITVAALALAVLIVGVAYSTTTASGSDAYGYVSQADGWLTGKLTVDQPAVADMPWRSARWSFSPLGYRPGDDPAEPWTIVPVYAPGLPLLMAVGKMIGGQEGMFWVVPISGALLVLIAYGIGRRLGDSKAGLVGAWLVATSPAMLFMLMSPMTDVPVAAAWAAACFFLIGATRRDAFFAGLASALAILIRPNLVLLAVPLGMLYVVRIFRSESGRRWQPFTDGVAYSLGTLPGIAAIAVINWTLYGSPLRSGYGGLDGMFQLDHVGPNARNYFVWLSDTQTPLIFAGIVALAVPMRLFWPATVRRDRLVPLALLVLTLWGYYCVYLVFEEWWYLRFVLAAFPLMMVGFGAVARAAARDKVVPHVVVSAVVILLGGYGAWQAYSRGAFAVWRDERRYVAAARMVQRFTSESSVILSMQHSGSLRYYAGRTTMRYDTLEARRLDRAVAWFAERNIRVFLFAEDWELPMVRTRFDGERTLERLSDPPIVTYRGAATIYLFEISAVRDRLMASDLVESDETGVRSVRPAPPSNLLTRRIGG